MSIIFTGGLDPGDARVGSPYLNGMNVFVYLSGIWQLVADTTKQWSQVNSIVFCREVGRSTNGKYSLSTMHFKDN